MIATPATETLPELYLDLLKGQLTRAQGREKYGQIPFPARRVTLTVRKLFDAQPLRLVRRVSTGARDEGRVWPLDAETMIGKPRLDNVHHCVSEVLRQGVPGDLIETGVWRGGAAILMRAVLKAYGDTERIVWAADSFEGLPKPNAERYPADARDPHWTWSQLAVSLEEVQSNFARYGLLDDQVRFLVGWFCDTLPTAPIEQLAVLRLDGDMYESTMDAFRALYGKLSVGGYVIVDDYGAVPACKAAVEEFRTEHGITEEMRRIDWSGVFWQRLR